MRTVLLALLLLLLPACGGGDADSTPDAGATSSSSSAREWPPMPSVDQIGEPLGTVDGMPIGTLEFDTMAARSLGRDGMLDDETRTEITGRLVDEKLLYMEALRQGIDKDPKIQRMMVNTLLKQEVYSQVRTSEITEEELKAYFEAHKDEFVVPEKVQIKRILIKPADGENAGQTMARALEVREAAAANPSDFKQLAQRHSKGPYARRGGDVGFVTPDGKPGVDPAVVKAAFELPEGQKISGVFETNDGLNIIYVPNRRARVERTFQQMRGSVLRKVKADKYKQLYDSYVGGLRGTASIELDDERIAAHQVSSGRPLREAPDTEIVGVRPDGQAPDADKAEGEDEAEIEHGTE